MHVIGIANLLFTFYLVTRKLLVINVPQFLYEQFSIVCRGDISVTSSARIG